MVKTEWLREGEVLAIHPDGPIDEEDFKDVGAKIDPVIAEKGRLEGLMVDASQFAGWDDAHALVAHIRFVHGHIGNVARVAAVGDQWWLNAIPTMEAFFGTPIRVFPSAEKDAAKAWLLETPAAPPRITFLPESEGAKIVLRITGRLRDVDYDQLKAEFERRAPDTGKLRLLVIVDEGFRGWTPKAFFDDIAFAFSSWSGRFEKLAVITEPGLVHWFAKNFPTAIVPYDIEVFEPEEQGKALAWLAE
ncbi:STAS/SEC14 domain-containing protein [Rhodobacteraceae bacterium NNCM2]|nr:STAS/SEC14 domain-containing protein [Coraliihabitans acroporae]